jgi:hypothetical protein
MGIAQDALVEMQITQARLILAAHRTIFCKEIARASTRRNPMNPATSD